MEQKDRELLLRAIQIAGSARKNGNHPFGAVLTDEQGNILLEAQNTVITGRDVTGHAETNLIRLLDGRYEPDFLSRCTLYASTEPCAMCSGAIYWSGIGRVVFAVSGAQLEELVGGDPQNPPLALSSREVFSRGQRPIQVLGPFEIPEAFEVQKGFWKSR